MVLPEPLCEKVFLLGFVTNNKDKSDVKECFMACYIYYLIPDPVISLLYRV